MNAMTKGLLTISLLAAAACDGSPTASSAIASPGDGGPAFAQSSSDLTFSSTQSQTGATPQSSSGGAGRIDFTGSITTPTPCYEVTASHTERRNVVTVTVSAANTGGFCTQVITNNNYQGAVTGLAAGVYNFTVIHDVEGSRIPAHTNVVVVE